MLVSGSTADLGGDLAASVDARCGDVLLRSGAMRIVDGAIAFVYKAAAEIGELGDNTAALRAAIRGDVALHRILAAGDPRTIVLGHTRWASVGVISEANAHPLDEREARVVGEERVAPCVFGVLNGDVDNHTDLVAVEGLRIDAGITTDAKLIPMLVAHRMQAGEHTEEAFRRTVAGFQGSQGIAAVIADDPSRMYLALRGSGQALYVGVAEDEFIVASEPYGLVHETARYVRMDGETPADPERASATRGQIVVLDADHAGSLDGIRRLSFDGTVLPVSEREVAAAEITTRDIDRGDFPHYLLKEISESPASFRKTLRGKIATDREGRLRVALGSDTLPPALRERLRDGSVRKVVAIGQGTAAVAGESLAMMLGSLVGSALQVDARRATELSGFELVDDMRDTLLVAISQSGTTTDTNRTVDLGRARGATVVAIVNRRNSDLVDKADGVLYTSDGRDVEMSVASTKAFYSQIAAGHLLALAIADEAGALDPDTADSLLRGLRDLPAAMELVIGRRGVVAAIAQRLAPTRRSWAVVGNGANRVAANEVRIKLSELCYKSIACDVTEDKKHIDLSSEPMVFVCAAGLVGSNADDVAKEVAIYGAHRAAAIVVISEGQDRFGAAEETIEVPSAHPSVAFVLSTVAGHLFGYEAALAIDASARPLREARAGIQTLVASNGGRADDLLAHLAPGLEGPVTEYYDRLRTGGYDGQLEASTAVQIATSLRYATGITALDSYQVEFGKVGTPAVVVDDLAAALTKGIEELTRPVDAIKHQAKTVTVGISRADEELLQVRLVREVMAAGASRDALSYRALRTLVALDPVVEHVEGYLRYRVEGDVAADDVRIFPIDAGGIATGLRSRTLDDPTLRGTKHRVASLREVTVARGRSDQRTVVIVPEVKDNQTVGLTLLHARFAGRLQPDVARGVLEGYQGRYGALKDAVTETTPAFDDAILATIDPIELLTEPVYVLADRWAPA